MKPLLLILLLSFMVSFDTPGEDFRQVFGRDYVWAANWMNEHDQLIKKYSAIFHIPASELKAIVFPELIRYNGLFNTIEIESLKFLYVKDGNYYADFSVGYFQMKPSFAKMVEDDISGLADTEFLTKALWNNLDRSDSEAARRERVKRLSNKEQQVIYLCAFYKICELKFRDKQFSSASEKVKLFSTCYNAGYRRSLEKLMSFQSRNDFLDYNYSSVSVFYFLNN